MPGKQPSSCEIESDGIDLFVLVDGVKIAKRGHPRTAQAGTWISLEPGWSVESRNNDSEVIVMHEGVRIH
jgi:hypothetical protein